MISFRKAVLFVINQMNFFLILDLRMESKKRASRRSTGGQSPVKSADKKTVTPVSATRRSTRLKDKVDGDTITTTPTSLYIKKASATRKRSLKSSDEDDE